MRIQFYMKKESPPDVVQKRFHDMARVVNGGVEFGAPPQIPPIVGAEPNGLKNMLGYWLNVTTPGANVEFTVNHNLQYIPTGFLVFSVDKAAVVYASRRVDWTAQQIFLKCNVATTALVAFVA